uniref:DNA replication checkpoint mediator MRC1 domain-containing protein n=1 Tax=Aegilops tauschii subsp. strangulata TaxID=200361 RepID=A0A453M6L4_AEGTS
KAPKESVASKKRAEKERRAQLESIHAESQRLLRETRKASFKPIAEPVYKPISSVLEKIRLRKLEIQKIEEEDQDEEEEEEEDASSEPESDPAEQPAMPEAKEVGSDDKNLKNDAADKEVGANAGDLNDHDAVISDKDLNKRGSKSPNKELVDNSQDKHEDNAQPSDDSIDAVDEEAHLPPSSSPTKNTDDSSSEDEEEEEDNDKENIYPGIQKNDVNTHQQPRRTLASDSRPDAAVLKDFLDVEAEEEDDSDDDMARFKDNEEDDGDDENEVLTALIAAGFEEEEVDHEKRNALHQKWLQDQDAAETNNFIQRLKYGHQEQKVLMEEDEDDIEDCEDESENERSHDLTPNIVRQNSEKAKQMIAKMFTDENDTYEHSDDEEIEEHLARQRISKREVHSTSFISPLEDDSSREMFSLIKKLNIAPQPPKRRGKQATSNLEMLMVGSNSNSSSKSSFLGRTTSGPISSSHRSTYKGYIFGRDDSNSNSKSCFAASESNSDVQDQANPSQPKKAKFSSSQTKPAAPGASSEGGSTSGASLFELLRRSTSAAEKQEHKRPESFGIITESQAVHQFSAFKLSRKFSKIGARN